jgi:hypothetical protein
MAIANFDHAPIASGDSDAVLDLLVEEEACEEAQQGARDKYGKVLLLAVLVVSAFACGAVFAKNVHGIPARSSGNRAVDLMNNAEFEWALSSYAAGKPWASVAAAYNELATGVVSDPALSKLAAYLAAAPPADKAALLGSIMASGQSGAARGGGVSLAMFGPLIMKAADAAHNSTNTNMTKAEWGILLSTYTAGKNWTAIAKVFNQVATGEGDDTALKGLTEFLANASPAEKAALLGALTASAESGAARGGASLKMFGPLEQAAAAAKTELVIWLKNGTNSTNSTNITLTNITLL